LVVKALQAQELEAQAVLVSVQEQVLEALQEQEVLQVPQALEVLRQQAVSQEQVVLLQVAYLQVLGMLDKQRLFLGVHSHHLLSLVLS
jgi:hypothetical protein